MNRVIARAFYRTGQNYLLKTTPGRSVTFRGGLAHIMTEKDMVHVLRLEGAIVEIDPQWVERLPGWVAQCGEHKPARATVPSPEGWVVGPDYSVRRVYDLQPVPADDGDEPVRRGPGRPRKVEAWT